MCFCQLSQTTILHCSASVQTNLDSAAACHHTMSFRHIPRPATLLMQHTSTDALAVLLRVITCADMPDPPTGQNSPPVRTPNQPDPPASHSADAKQ